MVSNKAVILDVSLARAMFLKEMKAVRKQPNFILVESFVLEWYLQVVTIGAPYKWVHLKL